MPSFVGLYDDGGEHDPNAVEMMAIVAKMRHGALAGIVDRLHELSKGPIFRVVQSWRDNVTAVSYAASGNVIQGLARGYVGRRRANNMELLDSTLKWRIEQPRRLTALFRGCLARRTINKELKAAEQARLERRVRLATRLQTEYKAKADIVEAQRRVQKEQRDASRKVEAERASALQMRLDKSSMQQQDIEWLEGIERRQKEHKERHQEAEERNKEKERELEERIMLRSLSPPASPFHGNNLYPAKSSLEKRYESAFGEVSFVSPSSLGPKPCRLPAPTKLESPTLERYENAFGAIQMSPSKRDATPTSPRKPLETPGVDKDAFGHRYAQAFGSVSVSSSPLPPAAPRTTLGAEAMKSRREAESREALREHNLQLSKEEQARDIERVQRKKEAEWGNTTKEHKPTLGGLCRDVSFELRHSDLWA